MIRHHPGEANQIVILSGGSGRTAHQVVQAALAQFPDQQVAVRFETKILQAARAVEVVRQAAEDAAVICHSLVVPAVHQAVTAEALRLGVPCIDVLGPALAMLGDHLRAVPRGRAGLLYRVQREQLDRIDAMDFTLAHDDGKRVTELRHADVVLVGASRTSKSVTCFYLASRGVRSANVPLIAQQPPPSVLSRLNRQRVIGLTMSAAHLESIRQNRLDRISHRPVPHYANLRDIRRELRQIREYIQHQRWRCIDVSYKATEEVADQIIEMLPQKKRARSK